MFLHGCQNCLLRVPRIVLSRRWLLQYLVNVCVLHKLYAEKFRFSNQNVRRGCRNCFFRVKTIILRRKATKYRRIHNLKTSPDSEPENFWFSAEIFLHFRQRCLLLLQSTVPLFLNISFISPTFSGSEQKVFEISPENIGTVFETAFLIQKNILSRKW